MTQRVFLPFELMGVVVFKTQQSHNSWLVVFGTAGDAVEMNTLTKVYF
jgi:hypothetical protein